MKTLYIVGVFLILIANVMHIFAGVWLHDPDRISYGVTAITCFLVGLCCFPVLMDEKESPADQRGSE